MGLPPTEPISLSLSFLDVPQLYLDPPFLTSKTGNIVHPFACLHVASTSAANNAGRVDPGKSDLREEDEVQANRAVRTENPKRSASTGRTQAFLAPMPTTANN